MMVLVALQSTSVLEGASGRANAFLRDRKLYTNTGGVDVTGGVNATGVITATSFSGDGSNLTGIGTQGPDGAIRGINVAGISTFNDDVRITAGGLNVTGVVTATSFVGALTGTASNATNVHYITNWWQQ